MGGGTMNVHCPTFLMRVQSVVKLYTDERMLDHQPKSGHPEQPARLATVLRHLRRTGQLDQAIRGTCRPATDAELLTVHTAAHIQTMTEQAAQGGGQVEADTWLSSGSETAARLAAGTVVEAVTQVIAGNDPQAFCVVRPPGHHARAENPMGFCLYGSVAIAAAVAVKRLDVNRILIIDWDVHHGNGTQEMFYENEQIGFYSIHRYPFYPGSGAKIENGSGRGLGRTKNVPIAYGTSRQDYLTAFETTVQEFADAMKPELILLSAGFDAHAEDPVGDLGLEVEDFETMLRTVQQVATTHANGRFVSVLEGGYNNSILANCVAEHYRILTEPQK